MNPEEQGALLAGLFLFIVLFGAAIAGARRKHWPEAPEIGSDWSDREPQERAFRARRLGYGYGLMLMPVILIAVALFGDADFPLGLVIGLSVLGLFGGGTFVWWFGGWPFKDRITRHD